jgi:ribonuclease PH
LTHQEELNCNAELIISYTPKKDKISFMELKSSKVSQQDFLKIMEANTEACKIVYKKMREEIIKASLQRYICSK